MSLKSNFIPISLTIMVVVAAFVTLPGNFESFKKQSAGHAFGNILSENTSWESMTEAERAPYKASAHAAGFKGAIYTTLGGLAPLYLLILTTIGLLTPSIRRRFKFILRCAFWSIWFSGMLSLSLGTPYWGAGTPFPKSIGPALMMYLITLIFFGIILGAGALYRRRKVPRP